MYVLDCWKAFRIFVMDVVGLVVREVKKVFAGLLLWKARAGTDLKADFDARETVEVSLNG